MEQFLKHFRIFLAFFAIGGYILAGVLGALVAVGAAFGWRYWLRREGYDAEPAAEEDAEAALQAGRPRGKRGRGDENARLAAFMADAARSGAVPVAEKERAPSAAPLPGRKPTFGEIRERVAGLRGKALFDGFAQARLAVIENPRDAHAAVEAALMAKRVASGKARAAPRLRSAARAIAACLVNGHGPMAAELFREFLPERAALPLAPADWEKLGRVLLGQGAYMEAGWTLHAGAVFGGDPASAQKRLIEVAGRASEAGQSANAIKLYQILLAKYPDSQYVEFVRNNVRLEEKKGGRAPTAGS